MGAAVCGEISEGGDTPLYPVKETVRADISLEGDNHCSLWSNCTKQQHAGAVRYLPKEITCGDLTWLQIFLLKKLTQWEEPASEQNSRRVRLVFLSYCSLSIPVRLEVGRGFGSTRVKCLGEGGRKMGV